MSEINKALEDAERTLERVERRRYELGPKTVCPHCRGVDSKVLDGRDLVDPYDRGPGYRRRRLCRGCDQVYLTVEIAEAFVRKKSA